MLTQYFLTINTAGRGMINVTEKLNEFIRTANVGTGLLHVFVKHTSASILICEKADPLVLSDLEIFMQRVAPDNDPDYQHDDEGPDDMPSHVRTMLTQSFLMLPITDNQLNLGYWQGIYLWEHRVKGRERHLVVTVQSAS